MQWLDLIIASDMSTHHLVNVGGSQVCVILFVGFSLWQRSGMGWNMEPLHSCGYQVSKKNFGHPLLNDKATRKL